MCAKPAKKSAGKSPSLPVAAPVAAPASAATPSVDPAAIAAEPPPPAWIDSDDPRKRMIGKIVLVAFWIYVAALCLLALDQTFHLGIFGPKVPPAP